MTDEEFRATVRDGVISHSRQALAEDKWKDFAPHLFYVSGGNDDPNTYARLKTRAEDIERNLQLPGNRIFYLSIPPSSFASVCEGLEQAGLATKPESHTPYARIIVEKPVGRDLASAQAINRVTGRVFDESQIFRIDHYLGKETVQNLMVVRFANSIFEPIWNHKYIDHVQITATSDISTTLVASGERRRISRSTGSVCDTPFTDMLVTVTPLVGRPDTLIADGYGLTDVPMKSVMVRLPPLKLAEAFGDADASPVLPPWQIMALVGDIVGTEGAGFTVITTSSVVFPQGALLPIVHRKVYVW